MIYSHFSSCLKTIDSIRNLVISLFKSIHTEFKYTTLLQVRLNLSIFGNQKVSISNNVMLKWTRSNAKWYVSIYEQFISA